MKVFQTLKAALPYAHDKDIRKQIERTLSSVENDIDEVDVSLSDDTERESKELGELLNAFDEAVMNRRAALNEAVKEGKELADQES